MKAIGILLVTIGLLSGLLGLRSYLRDNAYASASVVAKARVKRAEVIPNSSGKPVASIRLMLIYLRDGVPDSLEEIYPQFYSKSEPLPTIAGLEVRTPYVRYVPKGKRDKNVPDWVMVSNKDKHFGVYGRPWFKLMFSFIGMGIMLIIWGRAYRNRSGETIASMAANPF